MYTISQDTRRVRDRRGDYGLRPVPAEGFAAEAVLDDLAMAEPEEMVLILARYAALRAWLLSWAGGDGVVVAHAVAAARAHLQATPPGWAERGSLIALVRGPAGRGRTLALLMEAEREAEARGHHGGAKELRQAAHRLRLVEARYPRPSAS